MLAIVVKLSMIDVFGNPEYASSGDSGDDGKITLILDIKNMVGSSETTADVFKFLLRNITRCTNKYDKPTLPFEIRITRLI